jgi:uncharacterized C2H2 Zn-finger protein
MMAGRVYFDSTETYVFDSAGRLIKAWFACNGCGKIHKSRKSALECCTQKTAVQKYFVCMKCSSVFTRPDAFEAHRQLGCLRAANEAVNVIERHVCLGCGSTLTSKTALESHLRWHETGAPQKVVFKQGEQVIGAIITSGKPRLKFATEALVGYEPGEGHLVSCDRCGALVKREGAVSFFYGPRGEKVDLCGRCFRWEHEDS